MGKGTLRRRHRKPSRTPRHGRGWPWRVPAAGLAVIAAVALAILAGREGTVAAPGGVLLPEVIAAAERADPRILEVERRFLCPCGRCGGMELVECHCDAPGGALEARGAIVRLIASGAGVESVVATIAERYGSLREETALPPHTHGPGRTPSPPPASRDEGTWGALPTPPTGVSWPPGGRRGAPLAHLLPAGTRS